MYFRLPTRCQRHHLHPLVRLFETDEEWNFWRCFLQKCPFGDGIESGLSNVAFSNWSALAVVAAYCHWLSLIAVALIMAFRRYGLCRPPGIVRNPTGHLYLVIACCTAVVVALLLLNELTRSQGSHASHVAPAAVAVADQGDATKNSEENLVLLIAILSSVTEEGKPWDLPVLIFNFRQRLHVPVPHDMHKQ